MIFLRLMTQRATDVIKIAGVEVRKELNWKVKDPKLGGRLMNIIGTDTVVNSNPRKLGDINKLTLKFIQKSKTPGIGI